MNLRSREVIASLGLSTVVLIGAAACSGSNETVEPTTTTTTVDAPETTTTESQLTTPEYLIAEGQLTDLSIQTAQRILKSMQVPGKGVEQNGFYIGNKRAVVGEDGETGTADDAAFQQYPELRANFDPESGLVTFISIKLDQGEEADTFNGYNISFYADSKSPLFAAAADGSLSLEDYQAALDVPNSLRLASLISHQNSKRIEIDGKASINEGKDISISLDKTGYLNGAIALDGESMWDRSVSGFLTVPIETAEDMQLFVEEFKKTAAIVQP